MKDLMQRTWAGNPMPARLDVAQSVTGLLLGLFMWVHLFLVSSILLGKDAMFYVSGFFELKFLHNWQHGYPVIVTIIGVLIFTLFIVHAGIAVRKFPNSWRQYRTFRHQMGMMKHKDTNLWFVQAVTGFVMFFLGSVHIYVIATHPAEIGPYASADRFVSDWLWPLYAVLLVCVELHATIGMYRLAIKWMSFKGTHTRHRLKMAKNVLTVFFLTIGTITFFAYMKIGLDHRAHQGERYVPASVQSSEHSEGSEAR